MPRKRRKKSKNYFTQETEDAIVLYNNTSDPEIRSKIYERDIHYASFKLTENIRLDKSDAASKLYAEQILAIGNGSFKTYTINDVDNLIRIPDEWLSNSDNLNDLIDV